MATALADLDVLVIDCQAGGATPAYGDLLEIGWTVLRAQASGGALAREPLQERFVIPRSERRIPGPIRELTGWSEACIASAVPEQTVWAELSRDIARVASGNPELPRALAVIHFARFELPFLRDLHARLDGTGAFPLDAICLHAIAARLFPDLPRRNIRALAGYLGHSTDLLRRCGSHVEASAFIWRALVPRLEQVGVHTLAELEQWLEQAPPPRSSKKRIYPFSSERRRALPDRPGVYRFLRSNGDLLYVGKAASIKKRVMSHFAGGKRPSNERALELLTQVQDIAITETGSILEAALLESDEIKRLDPPYNVQLRTGERQAWFAARDRDDALPCPDAEHHIGPLPSRRALSGLHALVELARGAAADDRLQACALAVPIPFLPDETLFAEGWRLFAGTHLTRGARDARVQVEQASRAVWLARGRAEVEQEGADPAPDDWDLSRVLRRLERTLVQTGLLVRRARWLALVSHADIAFRERTMATARTLVLEGGEIVQRQDLQSVHELTMLPARPWTARHTRQSRFDAARYDRLRILTTELNRVVHDGGEVALRTGRRSYRPERVRQLLRWV